MALTLSDYLRMLSEPSYRPKARLTFLRMEDESPYETVEGDILDGNLQITRNNGVRRSCNLTLKNEDGQYIPNVDGLWVNRKFFLEIGLEQETYQETTNWQTNPDGDETIEVGRTDNTIAEFNEGTLTNVISTVNGLELLGGESDGSRITPDVQLSTIKEVDSSYIDWFVSEPQGTLGREENIQSELESGTLVQLEYVNDGVVPTGLSITKDPTTSHTGTWLSWEGLTWEEVV